MATRNTHVGKDHLSKSKSSMNADRVVPKWKTHLRTQSTIRRLKMYKSRPNRNKKGEITVPEPFTSKELPVARIMPDRRWFGNTRVVAQKDLETFREEIDRASSDPYSVLLRASRVPYGLLSDAKRQAAANLLTAESFAETFSAKRQRKRPKIVAPDVSALVGDVTRRQEEYDPTKDSAHLRLTDTSDRDWHSESVFTKGQSKRLWAELYKVLDSSDVVIQVLDARDPAGTRSAHVEQVRQVIMNCTT